MLLGCQSYQCSKRWNTWKEIQVQYWLYHWWVPLSGEIVVTSNHSLLGSVRASLKWADGKILKSEVDKQVKFCHLLWCDCHILQLSWSYCLVLGLLNQRHPRILLLNKRFIVLLSDLLRYRFMIVESSCKTNHQWCCSRRVSCEVDRCCL